jgi:hypothetical protein
VEDRRNARSKAEEAQPYVPDGSRATQLREERYQKLDGVEINKQFEDGKWYKGKVTFLQQEHPPYRFQVDYEDGDHELLSERDILKWRVKAKKQKIVSFIAAKVISWADMEEGIEIPDDKFITEEVYEDEELDYELAMASLPVEPPSEWCTTVSGLRSQLKALGYEASAEEMKNSLDYLRKPVAERTYCGILQEGVELCWLFDRLNVDVIESAFQPWDVQGDFVSVCDSYDLDCGAGRPWAEHGRIYDVLQFRDLKELRDDLESFGLTVAAPVPHCLSLAIPLFECLSDVGYCLCVPYQHGSVLSHTAVLGKVIREAVDERRGLVLGDRALLQKGFAWVCVFRTPELMRSVVKTVALQTWSSEAAGSWFLSTSVFQRSLIRR